MFFQRAPFVGADCDESLSQCRDIIAAYKVRLESLEIKLENAECALCGWEAAVEYASRDKERREYLFGFGDCREVYSNTIEEGQKFYSSLRIADAEVIKLSRYVSGLKSDVELAKRGIKFFEKDLALLDGMKRAWSPGFEIYACDLNWGYNALVSPLFRYIELEGSWFPPMCIPTL
ncbi:hypothetical protein M1B35_09835 [Pseudomonas sp. MAFF 302046]|uniref:Uncharacterized protein n=1 Tax=Pseudomonas morbosilactucae TaxID=2938197 RepID=A0ABT0JEU2_9PSED|nr:hypothetical protein [Pseudomonas morbosilactucae]MCK9814423.1 hypothetical protein [Pseudomonas morbosilactucae]